MRKKHHYKKKPGFLKKWAAKLHLWFGLAIGTLIFIIAITGALYVFKDEIEKISRKEYIYHNEQNIDQKQILPIRVIEKLVNEQTNEKYPIHWINVPIDKKLSYQVYWYEHAPDQWNYFDEFLRYSKNSGNQYRTNPCKTCKRRRLRN